MTTLGKWELDAIHHTDALSLMGGLPDGCIDLIVTSPPYDNLRTYNGYSFEFEPIAHESYRVLKDGGVLVWIANDETIEGCETLTTARRQIYMVDSVGFLAWDTMIWTKKGTHPNIQQRRYVPNFEFMLVMSKGEPATFNPLARPNKLAGDTKSGGQRQRNGEVRDYSTGRRFVADESRLPNTWEIAAGFNLSTKDLIAFEHPAMFPEKLAERHILTWSNPGDLVLDYFMGSGTTAKMARNNGRRYIGCDISLEYVELARKRLALPYTPPMFTEPQAAEPTIEQAPLFAGEMP